LGNKEIAIQRDRRQVAAIMEKEKSRECSLVDFSKESSVPRTTLQNWNNRSNSLDLSPAVIDFFESPCGQEFLHRLNVSMMLMLHEHGNTSLRCLSEFLQQTQLDRFLPASKSTLEKVAKEVELSIIHFADQERKRMSALMPTKNISIAEDETFPDGVCLVAIELQSNFILLEKMTSDRKTVTWDEQMEQAMKGLPVTIIQSVGDEAKSLVKHVKSGLGAHHSPDTFHIQQELTKAGSAQLKLKIKRETETLEKVKISTERLKDKKAAHDNLEVKPRGRPIDYKFQIETSENLERTQVAILLDAKNKNDRFHSARRSISNIYHPYGLDSGLPQSPAHIESKLNVAFDEVQKIVEGSGQSFQKRVEKARKLVVSMKATIAFFFATVAIILNKKNYDDYTRMLLEDFLIPACYLENAALKINDKDKAYEINLWRNDLMAEYQAKSGPFVMYSDQQLKDMLVTAKECAAIFQRSSSAVEGRNGQLALNYHNLHKLSARKLACLTALHNFDTKRKDHTTPAERFFENKHGNLFEYLLVNLKMPGRPRISSYSKKAS
jgi:hypothetical protein